MSWTSENAERASAEGWELCYVIDNGTSHPYYRIFGLRAASNQKAAEFVMAHARRGSKLHTAALHAMTASRVRQPAKTKAKR